MDSGLAGKRPRNDEGRVTPCPICLAFWKRVSTSKGSSAPVRSTNRCAGPEQRLRDARLRAYDVGGRGVLLLFLRSASLRRRRCRAARCRRMTATARCTWPLPLPPTRSPIGKRALRKRRGDREPGQMAARRRKHLFPRSRQPCARLATPGLWPGYCFPSPLWGRVGEGVARRHAVVDACAKTSRPPPLPLPTRGRGSHYDLPYTGTTAPRVTRFSGDARNMIVVATSSTFGHRS